MARAVLFGSLGFLALLAAIAAAILLIIKERRDWIADHLSADAALLYIRSDDGALWNALIAHPLVTAHLGAEILEAQDGMKEFAVMEVADGNRTWVMRTHGADNTHEDTWGAAGQVTLLAPESTEARLRDHAAMEHADDTAFLFVRTELLPAPTGIDVVAFAFLAGMESVSIAWNDHDEMTLALWRNTSIAVQRGNAPELPHGAVCAVAADNAAEALASWRTKIATIDEGLSDGLAGIALAWWLTLTGDGDPQAHLLPLLASPSVVAAHRAGTGTFLSLAGSLPSSGATLLDELARGAHPSVVREIALSDDAIRRDVAPGETGTGTRVMTEDNVAHIALRDGARLFARTDGDRLALAGAEELLDFAHGSVAADLHGACSPLWAESELAKRLPFLTAQSGSLVPWGWVFAQPWVTWEAQSREDSISVRLAFPANPNPPLR